ncbi:MAG: HlyC/CorC family transporter [bacterium]|nr:HlyC/CorC family transporter [bacterium]
MDDPFLWAALAALVVALLFSSTISLALRMPSRTRIADVLAKRGQPDALKKLVESLPHLSLANGILRSGAAIGVVLLVLLVFERAGVQSAWGRYGGGFGISWGLVLVFGVAIPNAWARYTGESLLAAVLPALHGLRVVLSPLVAVLRIFDELVRRLAGVPLQTAQSQAEDLEREILSVVTEGEMRGAMDEEEREMIESVIDLRDTRVEAIMTPRTEIVSAEKQVTLLGIKELITESGHSRIPVFEETIDNVLGVLYAKDLLARDEREAFDITQVMRNVLFIPETKLLRDLLHEFQEQKVHIAVVLDEYGGTAGLVTFEDILEELVGEIVDEYEPEEPAALHRIDEQNVEVDARMRVDDINDELNLDLPEDGDYETIGGFVFSTLGKIPAVGERCLHENVAIQVIAAGPRRITRLRLHLGATDGERPAD